MNFFNIRNELGSSCHKKCGKKNDEFEEGTLLFKQPFRDSYVCVFTLHYKTQKKETILYGTFSLESHFTRKGSDGVNNALLMPHCIRMQCGITFLNELDEIQKYFEKCRIKICGDTILNQKIPNCMQYALRHGYVITNL